ncbi:alpha/beta hydrolase [Modestobacter sp. VKM Ac-2986]|uniref:alpha/beta fold hydrolase n=1 Tax=Modestobacter sp. VKM Ac-2986 TaxID=3004140 RepID=UPI0022AB4AA9|nr:alpha/beta hydrolase [Modestobacter sp. VKM Ac-2986]MCZ2828876.1 alpha/beta hydrolase [Modestobacter sp. VKM Ac-2986]
MYDERPTVLLVHGAWHGPWVWARLQPALDALGWQTRTVQLPSSSGTADTAGVGPGLAEDTAAVRRALSYIDGPAVVLAHSYGGIPVSQATAGRTDVAHLVYLAAYQLDVGESMFSFHGVPVPASSAGLMPLTGDPRAMFFQDVPDDLAEESLARLGPQSLRSCTDALTAAGWHTIPATYLVCERDGALPVELQEQLALRSGTVRRLPSGHSPHLSMPGELAAVLTEAVRAVPA